MYMALGFEKTAALNPNNTYQKPFPKAVCIASKPKSQQTFALPPTSTKSMKKWAGRQYHV